MKFTCLQENLSKGLGIVNKAISVKAPLPILANVLIETEDGRLKLSAFNMETGISTYVGASVEDDGKITVPARLLNEFVSNLSPGNVTGTLKDDVLHITSGKTKSKFNGMNATTYPELPQLSDDLQILELSPKDFSEAIVSVGFSAATDDSRPILGGILLSYDSGVLTAASADGFRLSERVLNIESAGEPFSVVIPAKTLLETARILGGSESSIKFALNTEDSLALFEADGILITTRILPGAFPDYRKLIPDSTSVTAEFDTQELLEAVKLTHVFAKETNSAVNLTFSPDGVIRLVAISQESGDNKSEIDAQVEGEELEMSFNARFLLDFLNNAKSDRLSFSTNGSMNPGLIKPTDEEGYLHIIMPLRITN